MKPSRNAPLAIGMNILLYIRRSLLIAGNYSNHPFHRLRDWFDISHHPHVLRPGLLGPSYHFHGPATRRTLPASNSINRRSFRSDFHAVDSHWALHGRVSTKYAFVVLISPLKLIIFPNRHRAHLLGLLPRWRTSILFHVRLHSPIFTSPSLTTF